MKKYVLLLFSLLTITTTGCNTTSESDSGSDVNQAVTTGVDTGKDTEDEYTLDAYRQGSQIYIVENGETYRYPNGYYKVNGDGTSSKDDYFYCPVSYLDGNTDVNYNDFEEDIANSVGGVAKVQSNRLGYNTNGHERGVFLPSGKVLPYPEDGIWETEPEDRQDHGQYYIFTKTGNRFYFNELKEKKEETTADEQTAGEAEAYTTESFSAQTRTDTSSNQSESISSEARAYTENDTMYIDEGNGNVYAYNDGFYTDENGVEFAYADSYWKLADMDIISSDEAERLENENTEGKGVKIELSQMYYDSSCDRYYYFEDLFGRKLYYPEGGVWEDYDNENAPFVFTRNGERIYLDDATQVPE